MTYDVLLPGSRSLLVSIPTRADDEVERAETLTMKFEIGSLAVRRTVRLVD